MKKRPKLTITKMVVYDSEGHYRFHSVYYDRATKTRAKTLTIDLEGGNPNYEDASYIKTEKQLVWFLYKRFGKGVYRVICHLGGRLGAFTFWKGEVNENGFVCFKRERDESDLNYLRKELREATTQEEKSEIEDLMNIEKDSLRESSKSVRRGIHPFLRRSVRVGEFMNWGDKEDFSLEEEEY